MVPAFIIALAIAIGATTTPTDPYVQNGYNGPPTDYVQEGFNPPTPFDFFERAFAQSEESPQPPSQPIEQSVSRGMGNRTSDVEQWRPLAAGHFEPEDVDRVLCLMSHESGGNPNAKNPRSEARGLMQIMASVWAAEYGFSYSDLYNPEINLYVARKVKDAQGWSAWAPYNRGLCR